MIGVDWVSMILRRGWQRIDGGGNGGGDDSQDLHDCEVVVVGCMRWVLDVARSGRRCAIARVCGEGWRLRRTRARMRMRKLQ